MRISCSPRDLPWDQITIVFSVNCAIATLEPLRSRLLLMRIVGEDQFDSSSKLGQILRRNRLAREPRTTIRSFGVNVFMRRSWRCCISPCPLHSLDKCVLAADFHPICWWFCWGLCSLWSLRFAHALEPEGPWDEHCEGTELSASTFRVSNLSQSAM